MISVRYESATGEARNQDACGAPCVPPIPSEQAPARPVAGTATPRSPRILGESLLLHLCERRPNRVIELIRAAEAGGNRPEAVRIAQALVASPAVGDAISRAVRAQTYRAAAHDLDELTDGARLAVMEQVVRQMPQTGSFEQFRSWAATIARRHVMSVTRLKREQYRRKGASLDASAGEPGAFTPGAGPSAPSAEDELIGDWAIVRSALAAAKQVEKTVIVSHLVAEHSPAETVELVASQHGRRISERTVARIAESFRVDCRAASVRS